METRTTQTLDPRLLRRVCVACGYDGALLRDGTARRCARCGCNLRERPARSYVEMEGLLGLSRAPTQPWPSDSWDASRMLRRWIAFMILALGALLMIFYLSAAAFSI